ncbi:MAG TPA: AraC family transcriptional regulator, partial [Thermoanaerobaculia bacterium]|nr:AraC family transcriptional regulator [Thermoanaerobaculia bacterium]
PALEGLALLVLLRVAREGGGGDPAEPRWLHDAIAYIDHHHAEHLSLLVVAAAMGIPRLRLAAGFRRHRGTSVGAVIRQVRLAHAARALRTTRVPISEIAASHGFADHAHLTRLFRRAHGMTPKEFRRKS